MLKMSEISKLDGKAIETKIAELRKEQFDLRLQKHTTSLEKPHLLKRLKKDVARLKTALTAKAGK